MPSYGDSNFNIMDTFQKYCINEDNRGLTEFLYNLGAEERHNLIFLPFDPLRCLVTKNEAYDCIQTLLMYSFDITRATFLDAIIHQKYDYLFLFIQNGFEPSHSLIIEAGNKCNLDIMNLLFDYWEETTEKNGFNFISFP